MKIISVTNAHIFDGIEISEKAFGIIAEALTFSKFVHTIEYIDENGQKQTAIVQ